MKYTFGKTLASQKMEVLLDNNPSARRKISRMLSQYTSHLLKITVARDSVTVLLCMELLRDFTLKRISVMKDIPDEVRSYARNVVISRYRVYRKCFESIVPILKEVDKKKVK